MSDFAGWSYLRVPVEGLLSAKFNRKVTFERLEVNLLRRQVAVRLKSLFISAPDWSGAPHLAKVETLEADLDWGSLIEQRIVVHRFAVARGDIRALRDAAGQRSWSLGSNEEPVSPDSRIKLSGSAGLSVEDVAIELRDEQQDLHLELTVRSRSGEEQQDAESTPSGLVIGGKGKWRNDPVRFDMRISNPVPSFDGTSPINLEVAGDLKKIRFTFEGSISDLSQFEHVAGNATVSGESLRELAAIPGLDLPDTAPFRLEGTVARHEQWLKVELSSADVGSSSLKARLEYDITSTVPILRGTVDASKLVLADFIPSVGNPDPPVGRGSFKAQRTTAEKGRGSKKPILAGESKAQNPDVVGQGTSAPKEPHAAPLRSVNADLGIDLTGLAIGVKSLKPLKSLKGRLLLEGGVLKVQDLHSSMAGGTVTGTVILDGSVADKAAILTANLRWNELDLKEWLRTSQGGYLMAGRFRGEARVTGLGASVDSLLQSLSGTLKGEVKGGLISQQLVKIAGLNAVDSLAASFEGDKPLALTCALIDFDLNKGTMGSNLFLLNTADTLFFVQGTLALVSERLNLRLVQSPKDWSLMRLRAPILITGTLSHPAYGVEVGPVALKILSGVVLGAVTPIAALLPFLDPGERSAKGGCDSAIETVREKAAKLGPVPGSASASEGKAAKTSKSRAEVPNRPEHARGEGS